MNIRKKRKACESLVDIASLDIQDLKVGEIGCGRDLWDGKVIIVEEVNGMEIVEDVWCIE